MYYAGNLSLGGRLKHGVPDVPAGALQALEGFCAHSSRQHTNRTQDRYIPQAAKAFAKPIITRDDAFYAHSQSTLQALHRSSLHTMAPPMVMVLL